MKSAVQLIVFLACIFLCTSAIMKCRCIKTNQTVRRPLIAHVNVYESSPACPKHEVIAVMKDNNKRCLDPESDFTKRLLQDLETTTTTTTTAATTRSAATSPSVTRQKVSD